MCYYDDLYLPRNLYNMNIAIITTLSYHLECLGFLLQIFKNMNIDNITLYYNKKGYDYIEYYSELFKFNKSNISEFKKYNYDIVFKLTADDNINESDKFTNLISLIHRSDRTDKFNNPSMYISLYPQISSKFKCINFSSLYNNKIEPYRSLLLTNIDNIKKTIVFVGKIKKIYFDDDLVNFIKKK